MTLHDIFHWFYDELDLLWFMGIAVILALTGATSFVDVDVFNKLSQKLFSKRDGGMGGSRVG
jgi:hypothetical protein